ncbi:uncharacterized protein LOC132743535 [Ruditapes philippinarum]|uniref:uncharacterized protein LOC132743535 n=1 Tax=Ruditapes philippinarum TaxID=129788 RepID=UPI00295BF1D2|nr:uncharacterized protein LOC132743535 [Ruditapes philippinarum]
MVVYARHSFCMPIEERIETNTPYPRFANDTDLARVSLFFYCDSQVNQMDITEDLINDIRKQFADQLNCSLTFVDNILMAQSDINTFEMRLDIVNQGSIKELENVLYKFHKAADKGQLRISTAYANLTSMVKSVVYRQMIYGFSRTTKKKSRGDYFIVASFLPLVIVFSLVVIVAWKNMAL